MNTTKRNNSRKLIFFMLPVLITLCGLLFVSYANNNAGGRAHLNQKGKQFLKNQMSSADLVLWAKVVSVVSDSEDHTIFTYTTVEPIEVIQGQAETPLVVRQIGGTVGKTTSFVAGGFMPVWREGEEVLLFLNHLQDSNYYISGSTGKFTAATRTDGEEVFEISPAVRHTSLPKESLPDAQYSKSEVLEFVRSPRL